MAAMTDPHRHRSTAVLADRPPVVAGGRPRGTARLVWALIAAGLLAVGIGARVLWDGAAAIPTALQDAVTLSVSVLIESFPFVVLGVLLSVLVQLWLPPWVFEKLLPRTPWLRRMVLSLLGVLLPVCECGNVPLSRGLIQRGLSPAESLTFLLAAPILNPVTIITTYQAFGWDHGILVARILGGFVIANLVGYLFSKHPAPERMLTPSFAAACATHDHEESGHRMRRSVGRFGEEMSALLPALVIGSAIAGAIQVGVPREALVALGSNPLWSVLALMALAFVVSICSNVDAFFMLAFGSIFLPGGIVAFLVFGAMIDIKMLALMRTTYSTVTLVQVTTIAGLCALALGLGVNLIA
jgi:uncharacterized membrane protein YraQ (UPF0718 family)